MSCPTPTCPNHLDSLRIHWRLPEDGHGVLHHGPPAHVHVGDQVPGAVQAQQAALVQVLVLPDRRLPPAQRVVVVSEGQRALEFVSNIIPGSANLLLGQIGVVVFTESRPITFLIVKIRNAEIYVTLNLSVFLRVMAIRFVVPGERI